jgi:hypothetical protein
LLLCGAELRSSTPRGDGSRQRGCADEKFAVAVILAVELRAQTPNSAARRALEGLAAAYEDEYERPHDVLTVLGTHRT